MQASKLAAAVGIGIALSGAAAADAQTVVANVPAPGHDLRAAGEALEAQGDLLGAATLLEAALRNTPADSHLYWRIARDLLHHAERNPKLEDDELISFYERARDWAHAGRVLAPDCAECCLYEFAGTARLAGVRGVARALGTVREAGQLLEQCLESPPHWRDASGSEEASLYYGASVYYRLMPDSTWMSWATGLRSDATRAVGLARRAVELEGERARYRLELGAALLCDGARREDAAALAEGRRWLDGTAGGNGIDAERARRLREAAPDQACELSHEAERLE